MELESMDVVDISLEGIEEENEEPKEFLDLEDICRACANGSDHMIPIFQNEGAEHKLIDKIHRYLPIEVSDTDSLPLKLCFHCASTLLAWHELISGCLQAEDKLLQMLTNTQQKEQFRLKHQQILSTNGNIEEILVEDESMDAHYPIPAAEMERLSPKTVEGETLDELNPNELAEETVIASELVDELSSIAQKQTEANLISEEEESCTEQQLEDETNGNVPKNHLLLLPTETTERCDATKKRIFATKMLEKPTDPPENKELSCDKCCKRFLRELNLTRHARNCLGAPRTEESTFSTERTHRKETRIVNNGTNAENYCNEGPVNTEEADSSEEREDPKQIEPPSYSCRHCDFTAQEKKLLTQHVLDHHSVVQEREKNQRRINRMLVRRAKMEANGRVYYHCNDCGKNLFSTHTFMRHMTIHTGERPYICHICGKRFRLNLGLIRHVRNYHEGIREFPCDICGKKFSTKQYVDDHRRIHTGERPYVCEFCGKTFSTKAALSMHSRTHTDVFPFQCNCCGLKFRTKAPLEVHMTIHTGEKRYTCDICDRPFRMHHDMKTHRLIHFDVKPWQCSDCGLSYRLKRYLINHKKASKDCDSEIVNPSQAADNEYKV